MTHIGFTGTQSLAPVAPERIAKLESAMRMLACKDPITLHHGDCVGADALAHDIALKLRKEGRSVGIEIHPPENSYKRAWCEGQNVMHEVKPYLDRNHDIVDAASVMLALPQDPEREVLRSGTWATVRYSRKKCKRLVII